MGKHSHRLYLAHKEDTLTQWYGTISSDGVDANQDVVLTC